MRKIKKPKIGQYVLLSNQPKRDPYSRWSLGFLDGIKITKFGYTYRCEESNRWFKYCYKLTKDEGREWWGLFGPKPGI